MHCIGSSGERAEARAERESAEAGPPVGRPFSVRRGQNVCGPARPREKFARPQHKSTKSRAVVRSSYRPFSVLQVRCSTALQVPCLQCHSRCRSPGWQAGVPRSKELARSGAGGRRRCERKRYFTPRARVQTDVRQWNIYKLGPDARRPGGYILWRWLEGWGARAATPRASA